MYVTRVVVTLFKKKMLLITIAKATNREVAIQILVFMECKFILFIFCFMA
ncbi:hypothetical protein lbkm_1987 [Lachnospiraceae bacterium KM106-2]|nr:hypothetical protein lbkm_1987 [Lachnospiraceae bacterium KM106-2]